MWEKKIKPTLTITRQKKKISKSSSYLIIITKFIIYIFSFLRMEQKKFVEMRLIKCKNQVIPKKKEVWNFTIDFFLLTVDIDMAKSSWKKLKKLKLMPS